MKTKLLFLCCFFFTYITFSQTDEGEEYNKYDIELYNTLEDYKTDNGIVIGKYNSFRFGTRKMNFLIGADKTKYRVDTCWGFKIKERVFRNSKKNHCEMIVYEGSIVIYDNGIYNLRKILEPLHFTTFTNTNFFIHVSKNLGSQFYFDQKATKLAKEYPELTEMLSCIAQNAKKHKLGQTFNGSGVWSYLDYKPVLDYAIKCAKDFDENQ